MTRPRHAPAAPDTPADRKLASTVLMLLCTALMLPLLFPPFYCFFFAPVALVPFCVCILRRPLNKRHLLAYYLLGVAFFLPNLFWLGPVTVFGFMALALFVALYFALFAFGVHRLVIQLRMPATLAVPLVWTAVEYLRATFIEGGFPWFLLGNCLAPVPVLIQAADIFGVWGLSFLLAMLNGFVVDLLRLPLRQVEQGKRGRFSPVLGRLIAVVSLLVAVYLSYGVFRLGETTTGPGPRIAVIQENVPQTLKDQPGSRDDVFIQHLELARRAALGDPRPDLVAWPETMVTSPVNREVVLGKPEEFKTMEELRALLRRADAAEDADAPFRRVDDVYKALSDLVRQTGVPELLGYGAIIPQNRPRPAVIQNRTLLLVPDAAGGAALRAQEYSKRHLVPFGEYIPFRGVPGVSRLMLLLSPVDYDYSNTPGAEWTRFSLAVSTRSTDAAATQITNTTRFFKFATPICFEDVMPEPARRMSAPQYDGGKKADFLINVSNDGWFHWVELDQHLQACQLRAVENRIPIARSVNTGNSGFINSCGRVVKLVRDAQGRSLGAVGTESWVMETDARVTFFSRIGDLFPIICGILSTLLVGWTLVRPRRAAALAPPSAPRESA